ncbi:MAG: metal ABC transporter permease [Finegoldia sp.]|nr:metal ABC transporter permease [Finegoldia sp.]
MAEILSYSFMRRAFIVGVFVALILPLIGTIVVNKRNSMVGDALSHSSLAGIAIGLIAGLNPVLSAVIFCIVSAFAIEVIGRNFSKSSDIPTAIMMSSGIGLAAILSDFVPGAANFQSYLFGSIVAIPDLEFYLVIGVSIFVLLSYLAIYKKIVYIIFDEIGARVAGINVRAINIFTTFLIALTIAIASRAVGTLMVTSVMIIPVACAITVSKSFKMTAILGSFFGLFFVLSGILISYYYNLKPGGSTVMIGLITLILLMTANKIRRKN